MDSMNGKRTETSMHRPLAPLRRMRMFAPWPASYCLHTSTGAPRNINPGTYTIVAERSALGLRDIRRA